MNSLAIIPARGGSKRIPRKNIRAFNGRPIITYAIDAALKSGCFDEVMVSTDDAEIAAIAREHGATVPFLRSPANASDHAGSEAVFREVILRYAELGRHFSLACGLYPTAALTTVEHLQRGHAMLVADEQLTTVLPIQRFASPIQRALALRAGRVPMMHPEYYDARSQDLEPGYHDAGQWYWLRVARFLVTEELMGPNCAGLELSAMEVQDIDNEDDWCLAELKQQRLTPLKL